MDAVGSFYLFCWSVILFLVVCLTSVHPRRRLYKRLQAIVWCLAVRVTSWVTQVSVIRVVIPRAIIARQVSRFLYSPSGLN